MGKAKRVSRPPKVLGPVDDLPPPMRERGKSIYDSVITAAIENPKRWVAAEVGNRSFSAFKMGVDTRLAQLNLELIVKQRGNLAYLKYEGPKTDIRERIKQIRQDSRAQYGG